MIDLNKAGIEDLTQINGIGRSKAENIIAYRKENGSFEDNNELLNVKGIGKRIFDEIKEELIIDQEKVTIKFDPSEYHLVEVQEVHLVGEMNKWDPSDKSYALSRQENGIWIGKFPLKKGTEYKFMYDSDNWEEGKHIGDGFDNLVV